MCPMLVAEPRIAAAFKIRQDIAKEQRDLPVPVHTSNNDEANYPNKIGSFSKGLPHNNLGEVDLAAYQKLIDALSTRKADAFEDIPLGGTRKLTSPQAGLAFDLEGPDSHHLSVPPAPAFSSAEQAAEIAENYWMALARDVHFNDYAAGTAIIDSAADNLSGFSDFRGPKVGVKVTAGTLFRGNTAGDRIGPYLSQFLLVDVPFGAQTIVQTMRTVKPGMDYMTTYDSWLAVQRGVAAGDPVFEDADPTVRRYMRNGRDLSRWVQVDALYQAYFNANLILWSYSAPKDEGNPYIDSVTQDAFATFGGPHILSLVTEVATRALKATWFQKWFVHRRLRPEAFGGRIHNEKTAAASYTIHDDILTNSTVLDAVEAHNEVINGAGNGTYLLPMAFAEGSPLHPAYGSGHATVAGACVTILKAWYAEATPIKSLFQPKIVSPDGLTLQNYTAPQADQLTVGGELNKIAANIAFGRNIAGVHWRTDALEAMNVGERVAIGILRDLRRLYNEDFDGFTLTKFNGKQVNTNDSDALTK